MRDLFIFVDVKLTEHEFLEIRVCLDSKSKTMWEIAKYIRGIVALNNKTKRKILLSRGTIESEELITFKIPLSAIEDYQLKGEHQLKIEMEFEEGSSILCDVVNNHYCVKKETFDVSFVGIIQMFEEERENVKLIFQNNFFIFYDKAVEEHLAPSLKNINYDGENIELDVVFNSDLTEKGIVKLVGLSMQHRSNSYSYDFRLQGKNNNVLTTSISIKDIVDKLSIGIWDFYLELLTFNETKKLKIVAKDIILLPKSLISNAGNLYKIRPYLTTDNQLSLLINDNEHISHIDKLIVEDYKLIFKGFISILEFPENVEIDNFLLRHQKEELEIVLNEIYNVKNIDGKMFFEIILDFTKINIKNILEGTFELFFCLKGISKEYKFKSNADDVKQKSKAIIYPSIIIKNQELPLQITPKYGVANEVQIEIRNCLKASVGSIKTNKNSTTFEVILEKCATPHRSLELVLKDASGSEDEIIMNFSRIEERDENLSLFVDMPHHSLTSKKALELVAFVRFTSEIKCCDIPIITDKSGFKRINIKNKYGHKPYSVVQETNFRNEVVIKIRQIFEYERISSKLLFALSKLIAKLIFPFLKNDVWLIGENLGEVAQDNGAAFFEHCINTNKKERIYYVATKTNKDISSLQKYKSHIITYDSFKHLIFYSLSRYLIVSHGIRDVMPSVLHNKIGQNDKDIIYLQHGIVAMKKIYFNKSSYNNKIRAFVVSSEHEKNIFINHMKFRNDQIIVTGLSRFDNLIDLSRQHPKREIVVMPTWRTSIINNGKYFPSSFFYKSYIEFLSDKRLHTLLEKNDIVLNFYPHIEIQKNYIQHFENINSCKNIRIIKTSERTVKDLIYSSSLMITDYSSVAFDFNYLNKPVIFYQFDLKDYLSDRGSYINLRKDLAGDVVESKDELINTLAYYVRNDFAYKKEYEEKSKTFYKYRDKNNSERIYREIQKLKKRDEK